MKRVLAMILMLVAVAYPQAKRPVHFRITGVAVNARNGQPIPFCRMAAAPAAVGRAFATGRPGAGNADNRGGNPQRQETVEVDADAHGRFSIEVAAEGRYRLTASARNYRQQVYDAHGTLFTAIVLSRAVPAYDVVFRATADSELSGSVSDEAGEPIRTARVRLYAVNKPNLDEASAPPLQLRTETVTDDLGHYAFSALAAGDYKVAVLATPWYAVSPPAQTATSTPSPDPSLDFVYPVTWYPGALDETSADPIHLDFGDVRQADLRLNPIPSGHLLVQAPITNASSMTVTNPRQRNQTSLASDVVFQRPPNVVMLMPDGTTAPVRMNLQRAANSSTIDVGSLAPGMYRITDSTGKVSTLQVSPGGVVTEQSATPEIEVTLQVDGDPAIDPNQITLIDSTTGQTVGRNSGRGGMMGNFDFNGGDFGGRGGGRGDGPGGGSSPMGGGGNAQRDQPERTRRRNQDDDTGPREAHLYVPPGTYLVSSQRVNSFLTGITATGAKATGRTVTIIDGSPHLMVHMAPGLATLEGSATFKAKPSAGAMVLLIPATLGSPSSLTFARTAQTATDGSFTLANVIPGQYILLALDHGWGVNWHDPTTLTPYLLHGTPLDLAAASTEHPSITATAP